MSYEKRFYTSGEILELLEQLDREERLKSDCSNKGENSVDAVIIPPDPDPLTDEEDIDDDPVILNNVEGPNLPDIAGTFEIHTATNTEAESVEIQEVPLPSSSSSKQAKKVKTVVKKISPKWSKGKPTFPSRCPNDNESKIAEELKNLYGQFSPMDILQLFLGQDLFSDIVNFSTKYARDKNDHSFSVEESEIMKFIGILILTGYHTLPQLKLYWSKDDDKGVPIVRNTMSRNRFQEIKKYIHLSDNDQIDKEDKFSKVRPFITYLNSKFIQFNLFSHKLSIDEIMVPYFGRHSAKMFLKGKPIRFGFKLWALASSTGYLFHFIPYGGASQKKEEGLGLREQVVLELLNTTCCNPSEHKIFFDNFFTSYKLVNCLSQKGYFVTGTVRENRTSNCPLDTPKDLKKREKGAYDFAHDPEKSICAVRWYDNSVVTVMSNYCGVEPMAKVKRYNYKEKKYDLVNQPLLISEYNKGMGGVDLHDNAVANYRIRVRGKKWWWPLFINGIDSAVVNSWKFYKIVTHSDISQLDFRSDVARSLMRIGSQAVSTEETSEHVPSSHPAMGRPSKSYLPSSVRYDERNHLIVKSDNKQRRRCRQCKSQTIFICIKCQVPLHVECSPNFHKK